MCVKILDKKVWVPLTITKKINVFENKPPLSARVESGTGKSNKRWRIVRSTQTAKITSTKRNAEMAGITGET